VATPTPTPNTATTTRPERSSKRTARKAPLGWLPWALLGLLALLVAATLLVINAVDDDGPDGPAGDTLGQTNSGGSGLDGQDGDGEVAGTEEDSAQEGSSEDGAASAAPEASPAPDAGATGGASLTADGEDLLASVAGRSLSARAGQAVTGTATVESVVSDEGFWVGSSAEDRVFVFLTPEARQSQGESGFQVKAGQTVQLEGAMTSLQETPEVAEGVEAAEGADQLGSQGAYVRAESVTLA
jgi:hypothetical protein